jgi:oxygen-independent coproporphyrinogen-3 oxidase
MLDFSTPVPLSLYIHYPWCVKKCPYCDFNSHAMTDHNDDGLTYVDALCRDLEMELPNIWGRRVLTVFIGGGTPSLLSAKGMERLMSVLRSHINLQADVEVTMEANPGAIDSERFQAYRSAGITRLSVGAQSFDNTQLKQLGRVHDNQQILHAYETARTAGFDNINLDLMYGLPGQTPESALSDLQQAIDLNPEHVSWYQLTIEPNTVFYSQPPKLPDDDTSWDIQSQGRALLAKHGYQQYEISAYAKKGYECLHNINYWQFGDYLGLGAGAHGKITDVNQGEIRRYARHKIPASYTYLAGKESCVVNTNKPGRKDLPLEFMMNALRLNKGVPTEYFYQRTGLPLKVIEDQLGQAEEKGLMTHTLTQLQPTEKGLRYLNDLLQIYM